MSTHCGLRATLFATLLGLCTQASETLAPDIGEPLTGWMRDTQDPLLSDDPTVMPLPQMVNGWDETGVDSEPAEWEPSQWQEVDHDV